MVFKFPNWVLLLGGVIALLNVTSQYVQGQLDLRLLLLTWGGVALVLGILLFGFKKKET